MDFGGNEELALLYQLATWTPAKITRSFPRKRPGCLGAGIV